MHDNNTAAECLQIPFLLSLVFKLSGQLQFAVILSFDAIYTTKTIYKKPKRQINKYTWTMHNLTR